MYRCSHHPTLNTGMIFSQCRDCIGNYTTNWKTRSTPLLTRLKSAQVKKTQEAVSEVGIFLGERGGHGTQGWRSHWSLILMCLWAFSPAVDLQIRLLQDGTHDLDMPHPRAPLPLRGRHHQRCKHLIRAFWGTLNKKQACCPHGSQPVFGSLCTEYCKLSVQLGRKIVWKQDLTFLQVVRGPLGRYQNRWTAILYIQHQIITSTSFQVASVLSTLSIFSLLTTTPTPFHHFLLSLFFFFLNVSFS